MFKRRLMILLILCLLPLALNFAPVTFAQSDVPPQVVDAVNLLGQLLRLPLTINDMQRWSYDVQVFNNSNLGCASRTGTSGSYLAYAVELQYGGVTYDVRVSGDRTISFICGSNATPTPSSCSGSPAPRLRIGEGGRVTAGGLPNSVRVQPDPTAGAVGEIPAGASFTVLDGPRCGAGYTWWLVDYNGTVGWTPESDSTEYWLEPLGFVATAAPTATSGGLILFPTLTATLAPTATVLTATPAVTGIVPATPVTVNMIPAPTIVACETSLASRLSIGRQGRVALGGYPNNVRDNPGVSSAYLGEIPPGGLFNILAGPTCASGYQWWQVDYNGLIGWTPEASTLNYWLEPLTPLREAFIGANLPRIGLRSTIGAGNYDGGGIAFNTDSAMIAISETSEIGLWDSGTGIRRAVVDLTAPAYFAFNPADAGSLAVVDATGRAFVATLADTGSLTVEDLFTVPDFTADSEVFDIAWSGEAQMFAIRTGATVDIWEGATGTRLGTLIGGSQVADAVWTADATGLYYGGDDGVLYYWSVASRMPLVIQEFRSPIHHLALWQSFLAVAYEESGNYVVSVEDLTTHATVYYVSVPTRAAVISLALNNTVLAIGITGADGNAVGLWDTASSAQAWLPDPNAPVSQMRFSPDGTILAVADLNGTVRLWGIASP
jgi:uncharacterized protein YraI